MSVEDRFEAEGVEVTSIQKRAVAYFIDDVLVSIVVIILLWDAISSASTPEGYITVINSAFMEIVIIRFLYQAVFVYMYGATIGKQLMKIKVIDTQTLDKPDVKGAVFRAGFRTLGEVLFYFTFIFAFFDPLKRTLHDKIANTAVVNVSF